VRITGGSNYYFGVKYKFGISAGATLLCVIDSYTDSACQHLGSQETGPALPILKSTTWQATSLLWPAPPDVIAADFSCYFNDASIDQAFLNLNPTF
jgi:hypothetical protein